MLINNFNTLTMKKQTFIIAVLIAIIAFLLALRSCESSPSTLPVETKELKQYISTNKSKAAKIKDSIIYKEKVRVKYVTKWKEVRHDSLIPCPEKLAVADTVIYQDSSLIYSLKLLCKIDSNIIAEQSKVISADSITIKGLKKEVRKQKIQKWLAVIGAVTFGGVVSSTK